MATQRKSLIQLQKLARGLSNDLEGHLKGDTPLEEIADSFIQLVSTGEKFSMAPEGREFNTLLQKAALKGHGA